MMLYHSPARSPQSSDGTECGHASAQESDSQSTAACGLRYLGCSCCKFFVDNDSVAVGDHEVSVDCR